MFINPSHNTTRFNILALALASTAIVALSSSVAVARDMGSKAGNRSFAIQNAAKVSKAIRSGKRRTGSAGRLSIDTSRLKVRKSSSKSRMAKRIKNASKRKAKTKNSGGLQAEFASRIKGSLAKRSKVRIVKSRKPAKRSLTKAGQKGTLAKKLQGRTLRGSKTVKNSLANSRIKARVKQDKRIAKVVEASKSPKISDVAKAALSKAAKGDNGTPRVEEGERHPFKGNVSVSPGLANSSGNFADVARNQIVQNGRKIVTTTTQTANTKLNSGSNDGSKIVTTVVEPLNTRILRKGGSLEDRMHNNWYYKSGENGGAMVSSQAITTGAVSTAAPNIFATQVPGMILSHSGALSRIKENAGGLETGPGEGRTDGLFGLGGNALSILPDKSGGPGTNPVAAEDMADGSYNNPDPWRGMSNEEIAKTLGVGLDASTTRNRAGTGLANIQQFAAGGKGQDNTGGKHDRLIGVIGSGSGRQTQNPQDQWVMGDAKSVPAYVVGEPNSTETETNPESGETIVRKYDSNGFVISEEITTGDGEITNTFLYNEDGDVEHFHTRFNSPSTPSDSNDSTPNCISGFDCGTEGSVAAGTGDDEARQRALIAAITREWTGQPGHDDQHNGAGSSGQGTPWEQARRNGGGSGNSLGNGFEEHCKLAHCGENEMGVQGRGGQGQGGNIFQMLGWQINPPRQN